MVKNLPASVEESRDTGSVPGLGKFPGGEFRWRRISNLENPMDREAWKATVHGVTKSQT